MTMMWSNPLNKLVGYHNNAETYNISSLKWEQRPSYPFSNHITAYAILPVEDEFIIFGGLDSSHGRDTNGFWKPQSRISTIAGFNPFKNTWRHLGKLKSPRHGHSVIRLYGQFVIIGGLRYDKAGNSSSSSIESYMFNENGSNPEFEFSFEKIVPYQLGLNQVMNVPSSYTDQCDRRPISQTP